MMLNHRGRILTFLVIFSLLISLIPSGLPLSSANAEDVYGITTAPGVRVRKQASTSARSCATKSHCDRSDSV